MKTKNVTFTADERLIERAREKARSESTTLNNRVNEWMERYVAETSKKSTFFVPDEDHGLCGFRSNVQP